MPAFLRVLWYYTRDARVVRGVVYGPRRRNNLDLFLPAPRQPGDNHGGRAEQRSGGAPVVVFLTGGAWIIGYKAWAALMGKVLSAHGVLLIAPDYRNFPQGRIGDMLADASRAVQWAFDNARAHGGAQRGDLPREPDHAAQRAGLPRQRARGAHGAVL